MKKTRQRQIELPGLESGPTQAIANPRSPTDCEFPGTPSTAQMGVDRTERPAEPVEIKSAIPNLAGKTVYVVDSHSLIYQVFHALPEMTSPRGEPTGAIFGFARDMMALLEKKPDYLFAAFDTSGPTFRHELSTTYKENRPEMPDQLRPQIGNIRRMLPALGIPVLECEGWEADDILATLARLVEQAGGT